VSSVEYSNACPSRGQHLIFAKAANLPIGSHNTPLMAGCCVIWRIMI
jgi:hypothetical protein